MIFGKIKKIIVVISLFLLATITLYYVFDGFKNELYKFSRGYGTRFDYFTIQTNLMIGIWFLLMLIGQIPSKKIERIVFNPFIGLAVTVYITITGIIYWAILVGLFDIRFNFRDIWQHTVVTIGAWLIYLFVFPHDCNKKQSFLKSKNSGILLIYPLIYMAFAFWVVEDSGRYIYPFLSPYVMGGDVKVVISCILIAMVFIFVGFVLDKLSNIIIENR